MTLPSKEWIARSAQARNSSWGPQPMLSVPFSHLIVMMVMMKKLSHHDHDPLSHLVGTNMMKINKLLILINCVENLPHEFPAQYRHCKTQRAQETPSGRRYRIQYLGMALLVHHHQPNGKECRKKWDDWSNQNPTCFQLVPEAEEGNEHLPPLSSADAGRSRPAKKSVKQGYFLRRGRLSRKC